MHCSGRTLIQFGIEPLLIFSLSFESTILSINALAKIVCDYDFHLRENDCTKTLTLVSSLDWRMDHRLHQKSHLHPPNSNMTSPALKYATFCPTLLVCFVFHFNFFFFLALDLSYNLLLCWLPITRFTIIFTILCS